MTQTEPTRVATTLNSTHFEQLVQVKDFPFMWSLAGYLMVALAKILLSLFSIQVNMLLFIYFREIFGFSEKMKKNSKITKLHRL